jgi:hypothetical protein
MLRVAQLRQALAQLDHVAVAVLPIVEERKIVDELVDGHWSRSIPSLA